MSSQREKSLGPLQNRRRVCIPYSPSQVFCFHTHTVKAKRLPLAKCRLPVSSQPQSQVASVAPPPSRNTNNAKKNAKKNKKFAKIEGKKPTKKTQKYVCGVPCHKQNTTPQKTILPIFSKNTKTRPTPKNKTHLKKIRHPLGIFSKRPKKEDPNFYLGGYVATLGPGRCSARRGAAAGAPPAAGRRTPPRAPAQCWRQTSGDGE